MSARSVCMVQPTDQENEVSKRFVLSLKLIRSTGKETSSNQVATFKFSRPYYRIWPAKLPFFSVTFISRSVCSSYLLLIAVILLVKLCWCVYAMTIIHVLLAFSDQAPFDPNAKADKFYINVEVCSTDFHLQWGADLTIIILYPTSTSGVIVYSSPSEHKI